MKKPIIFSVLFFIISSISSFGQGVSEEVFLASERAIYKEINNNYSRLSGEIAELRSDHLGLKS